MFLLALNALTLPIVLGGSRVKDDTFCLDLEVGDADLAPFDALDDDEVDEESGDKVCVWHRGYWTDRVCHFGIERIRELKNWDCFYFQRRSLDKNTDFYIMTEGTDAVWIDRFRARRFGGFTPEWEKIWGQNDSDGWCLSNDRNDHLDWNHDDRVQHVPDNQCYHALRLRPNGSVWGYHSGAQRMCRVTKTMGCKESCDSGWKHVDTTGHGCCSSWSSCFGTRKVCAGDTPCRRRTEFEDADTTVEVLPPDFENEENWVLLTPPTKHADASASPSLVNRLSEALLSQVESAGPEAESAGPESDGELLEAEFYEVEFPGQEYDAELIDAEFYEVVEGDLPEEISDMARFSVTESREVSQDSEPEQMIHVEVPEGI